MWLDKTSRRTAISDAVLGLSFIGRYAPPAQCDTSGTARSSTSGTCSGIVRRRLFGVSGSHDRSTSARSRPSRLTPGCTGGRACPATRSCRPTRRSPATRLRRRDRRRWETGSARCGRPVHGVTRCVSGSPRRRRRTCHARWSRLHETTASSASRSSAHTTQKHRDICTVLA